MDFEESIPVNGQPIFVMPSSRTATSALLCRCKTRPKTRRAIITHALIAPDLCKYSLLRHLSEHQHLEADVLFASDIIQYNGANQFTWMPKWK